MANRALHRSRAAEEKQQQPPREKQKKTKVAFPNLFHSPTMSSTLDTVDPSSISPAAFHSRYILTRTPCLLSPPTLSPPWHTDRWSNAYLKAHAGHCAVQVEKRLDPSHGFGQGGKQRMPFRAFIDAIEADDDSRYLTTQYADDDDDPAPTDTPLLHPSPSKKRRLHTPPPDPSPSPSSDVRYLLAPPLTALLGDFPLLPRLFESLVPHQLNLWMGHALRPTSSRLHHDHHDNLYCLLRGTKTFTLVSPAYAEQLRTVGRITSIRRNGLVCYDGEVHDDGSHEAERLEERRRVVEERMAEVEAEVEALEAREGRSSPEVAEKRRHLEELEEELDEVLTATLDIEGEDGEDSDVDDFEEASTDEVGEVDAAELQRWKQWMKRTEGKGAQSKPPKATRGSSAAAQGAEASADSPPPNFSALTTATLPASIPRLTVRLQAPAMLYLPASWFHEVFSETGDEAAEKGHVALNYWFLPPDRLDGEEVDEADGPFARSYAAHELWAHRWERQKRELEHMHRQLESARKSSAEAAVSAERLTERNATSAAAAAEVRRPSMAASKGRVVEVSQTPSTRRAGGVFGQRGWRQKRSRR